MICIERPGSTFNVVFQEFDIVEHLTAADERRHGIAHMSSFLSICNLINKVKEYLLEGSPIPSQSTVVYFPLHKICKQMLTAADERRHGTAHMSSFLSICNLIKKVKEYLLEGSPIPSQSTVVYFPLHQICKQKCNSIINER